MLNLPLGGHRPSCGPPNTQLLVPNTAIDKTEHGQYG